MQELKKKINNRVKEFVDVVFDEADDAETEQRYLNKSKIGKALNELYSGMDLDFIESNDRIYSKKKGMFWRQ